MYKIYRVIEELTIEQCKVSRIVKYTIADESNPPRPYHSEELLNWDNLKKLEDRYKLNLVFANKKKGQILIGYTLKEWKKPKVAVSHKISIYEERKFTVKELLEMFPPSPELAAYIVQEFGADNLRNLLSLPS